MRVLSFIPSFPLDPPLLPPTSPVVTTAAATEQIPSSYFPSTDTGARRDPIAIACSTANASLLSRLKRNYTSVAADGPREMALNSKRSKHVNK